MASLPEVISLQRAESLAARPAPADPDIESSLNTTIEPRLGAASATSPGPAPEGWFHTGSALHGSQQAWAKGYTGAGVRYMSNDSGADYCHPDLFGTWAYIEDPSSPYYGLPEMFDSASSYLAAFDFYLGTTFIADGLTDYADTSTLVSIGAAAFAPMGAAAVHSYTLPATSISGAYHIGSHPDKALADVADLLSAFFGDGTALRGERAAVLVVDERTAGVYDTVYADLNYNYDFTDDAPARLARDFSHQEVACLDYDGDGLNDVSGGLVYFIADGVTPVPTLGWLWGIPGSAFGNGNLVAFHVQDFTEGGGTHGMGTTSVATGQGVVAGSVNFGPSGPPQAGGRGLVVGPGKDMKSTQNGDFYMSPFVEDAFFYAGLGYDGIPGTADDIQIVSNSWGISSLDNDGFDFESRLIDSINRALAPNTALLFSAGNGAAGYGTVVPPSPASAIGVGASTLFDSIGIFEAIAAADQIVGGDPMSWSGRGPGVRNVAGADVVATGAFGTGDLPLNAVLWGAVATESFGGTSMAAPVAAGNLALIYQAWRERTGAWPTFADARAILMGSAKNTHHDVWTQGAGLVDADRGTDVAAGRGSTYATPPEWSVGDYRGAEYEAFAHIIHPGESDTQVFTLHNYSDHDVIVRLTTSRFRLIGTHDYSFTSLDQSLDHGLFTTPDYVFRIDRDIPHGTDLLMVRVTKPYDQFDPNDDLFEPFNNWRVHLQNWTDLNHDGRFWDDENHNGKVDVVLDAAGNIVANEMQTGEHVRFTYGYNVGPTQQVRMARPLERMADGLLLTFRHRDQVAEVPNTDLKVEASFWKEVRWNWIRLHPRRIRIPAHGSATFEATIMIPKHARLGMYEGSIIVSHGGHEISIPVSVAVAAEGTSFSYGRKVPPGWLRAIFHLGLRLFDLYENSWMFGYTDYSWRAEAGDWRFFWTDIHPEDLPASGAPYLVVDNSWATSGTDIDTVLLGPTPDRFSTGTPGIYGPYTVDRIGGSVNTHIGSGRWLFQTSSGGSREIIATPAQEGLHAILFHQVKVDGRVLNEPFGGRVGLVTVDPGAVIGSGSGTMDVTLHSELDLRNFVAEGFGLSAPTTEVGSVNQDDPDDPSTASFVTTVDITHGGLLEVRTGGAAGNDLDLYVYGPGGQLLGASTTPTDQEFVSIHFPADGTYTVAVHGWNVPAGTTSFNLTINAVQGFDVTVDHLPHRIRPGGSATITVCWEAAGKAPGTYFGLVLMGPADAPGLLQVPITVTVP
jgi:hypothetical protein